MCLGGELMKLTEPLDEKKARQEVAKMVVEMLG